MSTRLSKGRRKGKSRTPYKYHLTREQIIKKNRNIDEQLEEAGGKKPCGGCGSESSDHDQGCPTVPDKKLSTDELVEQWHTGDYGWSLEEHLGWTKQEYSDYVTNGLEPGESKLCETCDGYGGWTGGNGDGVICPACNGTRKV